MLNVTSVAVALAAVVLLPGGVGAQAKRFALETAERLVLLNVSAEPATHEGRKGVRVVASDESRRMAAAGRRVEQFARVKDVEFSGGTIEVELSGAPAPDAPEGARGFVGIAFRLQPDNETYDAFYLRPTNGRAEDQERRNRSVQYISHPEWPWHRLRKETPSKHESYVDLVPGTWTKIRIEVRGSAARLYVHDQPQPTLVVNDVKTGAERAGGVALWIDTGTVAHFRNLSVDAAPPR